MMPSYNLMVLLLLCAAMMSLQVEAQRNWQYYWRPWWHWTWQKVSESPNVSLGSSFQWDVFIFLFFCLEEKMPFFLP